MKEGAIFSQCRQYRYILYRIWDDSKPIIGFVGLNPSTANETTDDPTIRKVKGFAKQWGYGGVYMLNLFGFVTAYPKVLKESANPIGDNDMYLKMYGGKCDTIVFAWGNFDVFGRDKEVVKLFENPKALNINKNGSPKHPLYVPYSTQLVDFPNPAKPIG